MECFSVRLWKRELVYVESHVRDRGEEIWATVRVFPQSSLGNAEDVRYS